MADSNSIWSRLFTRNSTQDVETRDFLSGGSFVTNAGSYFTNFTEGEGRVYTSPMGRACSNVIGNTVANTKLRFYKKGRNGQFTEAYHPISDLLCVTPDGDTTAFNFFHALSYDIVNNGVGYAEVVRDGDLITALHYISSTNVTRKPNRDYSVQYINKFGVRSKREVKRDNMVAVYSTKGIGIQKAHKDLFQLESYLNTFTKDFFEKGGTFSTVISFDQTLTAQQREDLRKSLYNLQGQAGNHGTMMLDFAQAKVDRLSAAPGEADTSEINRFVCESIARLYGVPAAMVGLPANITFNNMENQNILFAQKTIMPLLESIRQEVVMKLLTQAERKRWKVEFDTDHLLKGDSQTQATVFSTYLNSGIMTANEIRAELGLSAVEGGDELKTPLNLVDASEASKESDDTTDNDNQNSEENGE